jgi:hypothetical protein
MALVLLLGRLVGVHPPVRECKGQLGGFILAKIDGIAENLTSRQSQYRESSGKFDSQW